jgi:hypothetical protein
MADDTQLINAFREDLAELPPALTLQQSLDERRFRATLRKLNHSITVGLSQHRYVAFHYRSSVLPEGRYSPFTFNHATLTTVSAVVKAPDGLENEMWARLFLESLLQTYLFIMGRDASFSEYCILSAQDVDGGGDKDGWQYPRPMSLVILRDGGTKNLSVPDTVVTPRVIFLPEAYYEILTRRLGKEDNPDKPHSLPGRMYKAVKTVMETKKSRISNWEEAVLDSIADYRKVYHLLENPDVSHDPIGWPMSFTCLQRRSIESALCRCAREISADTGGNPPILKAAKEFFGDPIPLGEEREVQLRHFFRVIQATFLFEPLLGDDITVYPFKTLSTSKVLDQKEKRMYLENLKDAKWSTNEFDNKYPTLPDLFSGITVYGASNSDGSEVARVLAFLKALSFAVTACWRVSRVKVDFRDETLQRFFSPRDKKKIMSKLQHWTPSDRQDWLWIGIIAGDRLRGVAHEGKRLGLNLAIGTDVEFRDVLRPVYAVRNPARAAARGLGELLENFPKALRTFVRRNSSFLDVPHRFVCLKMGPGPTVQVDQIADLKEEYHRATTSQTAKEIVTQSGLTFVHLDPSARVRVFAQTKPDAKGKASCDLFFRCGAAGHWEAPRIERARFMKLPQVIEQLRAVSKKVALPQSWPRFVEKTLGPVIEDISEDPFAGAIIVIVENQDKLRGRYIDLPEADVRLEAEPENNVEFASQGPFKRMAAQDGATIVSWKTGRIQPRVQLLGNVSDQVLAQTLNGNKTLGEKATEWGTRHMSAVCFVARLLQDEFTDPVYCIVISQDGEVHLMRNRGKAANHCQQVLLV